MASALDILSEWAMRADVAPSLARQMATGNNTIYSSLIHAYSILNQLSRAQSVLRFTAEKWPARLDTHYFRALLIALCNADDSDPHPHPQLSRVIGLYERAMAIAATSNAALAATYDSAFAIAVLYAYARAENVNGVSATIDYCSARGIAVRTGLSGHESSSDVFARLLTLCADRKSIEIGRKVYSAATAAASRDGREVSIFAETAYLHLLMACGDVSGAEAVFESLRRAKTANLVTYTAMLSGYAANHQPAKAFALFDTVRAAGLQPNSFTFASLLAACAECGAVDRARELMSQMRRASSGLGSGSGSGSGVETTHNNAYLHVLMQSGAVSEAEALFESLRAAKTADLFTYNAMISGYAVNRETNKAFALFDQFDAAGLRADSFTFASLLTACSHTGAVERARKLMARVRAEKCFGPMHETAYLDVMARSGELDAAERYLTTEMACAATIRKIDTELLRHPELIATAPAASYPTVLSVAAEDTMACMIPLVTLLAACRTRKDVTRAERVFVRSRMLAAVRASADRAGSAFDSAREFVSKFSSMHLLMANIYSEAERAADATAIWSLRTNLGLKKEPAKSWIAIPAAGGGSRMFEVFVNDKAFVSYGRALGDELKREGYVPVVVLDAGHPLASAESDMFGCGHTEMLALALALSLLRPVTPSGAHMAASASSRRTASASRSTTADTAGDRKAATAELSATEVVEIVAEAAARGFGSAKSPIRIVKNLRVCPNCHAATKFTAKLKHVHIVVRDANVLHCFTPDGKCSCGDFF